MLYVRLWLFSFIGHAKDIEVQYIPCSKVGLDLWKWMRLKETSKMQTLSQKIWIWIICNQTCWNNTEHHFVTYWATYQHVGRQFIARIGSCKRSAGGDMVRIKCWVCHFNGTITVVLHVRLRPLCKWFSVQHSPWSDAFHFGISLLVAHFMRPVFFSFPWKFPQFCVQIYGLGLGLHFRFRVRLMLRVKFRGYV